MYIISFVSRLFRRQPAETAWAQVTRWVVQSILLLIPLVYFPGTSFPVAFNKTFALVILIWIAALLWSIDRYLTGHMPVIRRPLAIGLGGYAGFVILSFILSPDVYRGVVGISGFFAEGIVPLLSYGVLFYIIITGISREGIRRLMYAMTCGLGLGTLITLLQRNGVFILSGAETQVTRFFTVASATDGVAAAAGLCLLLCVYILIRERRSVIRILAGSGAFMSAVVLYQLALLVPLYILTAVVLLWLASTSIRSRGVPIPWVIGPSAVAVVLALIIIAIGFGYAPDPVSQPVTIPFGGALEMAGQRVIHSPLWGVGPQNIYHDYSTFRPASINETSFWNLRFVKSNNAWLGIVHSLGIGAFAALVWLCAWVAQRVMLYFRGKHLLANDSGQLLVLSLVWLVITIHGFVANYSPVLWMWWWVLLALMVVSSVDQKTIYSIKTPRLPLSLGIMAGTVAGLVLLVFFGGRVWQADRTYVQAQGDISAGASFESIISQLDRAIELNPYETKYYELLAQGYVSQAKVVATQTPDALAQQQEYTQLAINAQRRAEAADPYNPEVYESSAGIYDTLRTVVANADIQAVAAYDRAIAVDENNPLLYINRGRARLLVAQANISDGGEMEKDGQVYAEAALSDFQRAQQLKSDLLIADYNIALAHQILGDTESAIAHLENTAQRYPEQPDVLYTLATLYFEHGDLNAALSLYDTVNIVAPSYRGTYWQRSFIYEQQGNLEAARSELEALLEIDPENAQATDRLQQLTDTESDIVE